MAKQADLSLQVHEFLPHSRANGPGLRAVVWLQGCSLACLGCFNPETHQPAGGSRRNPTALAAQIVALPDIEGITISGGEPLQQPHALAIFLEEIRKHSALSIILFTGFEPDEIQRIPKASAVLGHCDVVIAGRYRQDQHLAADLRGSVNKQYIFLTSRYELADFTSLPPAEIWINKDGSMVFSGIAPVKS